MNGLYSLSAASSRSCNVIHTRTVKLNKICSHSGFLSFASFFIFIFILLLLLLLYPYVSLAVWQLTFLLVFWFWIKGILSYEMEGDDSDLELPYYCTIKVHRLMCLELKKLTDRILRIFPAMELSRPRSSGLQAVCSLHVAVDKAKLLIQHCSESSKFYLAITGDKILLRCEKIRNYMELCLTQIHDAVPPLLAAKIHGIIDDLRTAEFCLESSENEAGVVISALLRDICASNLVKTLDINALKLAALRLHITSPLAVLIERRSIKKLLERDHDFDPTKKKILKCLFHILRKYGNSIWQPPAEGKEHTEQEPDSEARSDESSSLPEPPEEFKCPISGRLLYEPVVIATGKTYERVWIDKWFGEGHRICPVTRVKLDHLSIIPNTSIQGLILKWCANHGITVPDPLPHCKSLSSSSVPSFGTGMDGLNLPSSSLCSSNTSLTVFSEFASLPWRSQCMALQDLKGQLLKDKVAMRPMTDSPVKALIRFMKDAQDSGDVEAQKDGAEVLSAMVAQHRWENEKSLLDDEDVHILASFLDSEIVDKALVIVESLSSQECCKTQIVGSGVIPSIMKILDTPVRKYQMVAFKTLSNLSSNPDVGQHMVYLDGISKVVAFLGDHMLAGHCIKMVRNLCDTEEARTVIANTDICFSSMAGLLEGTSQEEQQHALDVLLSLGHEHAELVMNDNVIQSIVVLSVNGKSRVKESAMELLRLLGRPMECQVSVPVAGLSSWNNDKSSEEKKLAGKAFRFMAKGRKRSVFRFLAKGTKKVR